MTEPEVDDRAVPQDRLWFKVTGMLQQNWAMVVESGREPSFASPSASVTASVTASASASARASVSASVSASASESAAVTVLFFDDHGGVFDELEFSNAAQAEHALAFNGFTPLSEQPGFRAVAGLPRFPLRRGKRLERPVYSSGEYWQQPPGLERVTQRRTMTPAALERFVQAQAPVIDTAMEELRAGRKETHWMWFVFPQLHGLGHSLKAQKYGIVDLNEARAYLEHPLLGRRLHECFRLVLQHTNRRAEDIFGTVDAMKFRSCATLFERASVTPHSVFQLALKQFYGCKADPETVRLL